jgi:hypothetical protein
MAKTVESLAQSWIVRSLGDLPVTGFFLSVSAPVALVVWGVQHGTQYRTNTAIDECRWRKGLE